MPPYGPFLASARKRPAHATLICCAAPLGYRAESHTLVSEGADPLATPAWSRIECASEKEGPTPLLSLSQNCRKTGSICRMDARRAWMGPPQGASVSSDCRPLPSPIRYRRIPPQSPMIAVRLPRPSWPVRRPMAFVGKLLCDCCSRLRHLLEDGVDNAEAPSLFEGPTHRIFSCACRSFASA